MNGTDFIPLVIEMADKHDYKVYLLGTSDEVLDKAKSNLKSKYPNLNIVGSHNGFFSKEEEVNLINDINQKEADILIVGMGVPLQEIWIQENKDKLTSVNLLIAGGAIIDFISGTVKRAPSIWRKLRVEWAFRLLQEPKRLAKRYLIGNVEFLCYLFAYKYKLKTYTPALTSMGCKYNKAIFALKSEIDGTVNNLIDECTPDHLVCK